MPLLPRLPLPTHPSEADLVALLDHELPLPEQMALHRHIGSCPRCADLLTRLEDALGALAAAVAEPEPVTPIPSSEVQWRLNPTVPAGAGLLVGALVVAGLLVRHYQRRAGLPLPTLA